MSKYNILINGEVVVTMEADFAQASSPIKLDGDSTPYQVADFRHRVIDAAEGLLLWSWSQGSPIAEVETDDDNVPSLVGSLSVE